MNLNQLQNNVTENSFNVFASVSLSPDNIQSVAENVAFSTKNAAHTNHGRLACMWALNHVMQMATGEAILADSRGNYNLSTIQVTKKLANDTARFKEIVAGEIKPGDIAIAATEYANGGVSHRGHGYIVGSKNAVGEHLAWHNSSSRAMWRQSGTIEGYATKRHGERLRFFRVK